jgi:hypothetical protein
MKTLTLFFASLLCFAAEPQTGIDFSQKLMGPDNKPLVNDSPGAKSEPLTLGFVCSQVLYAAYKDDAPDRKKDHELAALAKRIAEAGSKHLSLTNDQIHLILDRLYKGFPKITAYAAECLLDPVSCASDEPK